MSHFWFVTAQDRRYATFALFACGLALIVILLGAYTRLTNAGLSCPDWPHCYGYLTAPHTASQMQTASERFPSTPVDVKKAWTEMTHRYVAGTEGLLIIGLAGLMLINRHRHDKASIYIAGALLVLLGTQVLLGMLTVTAQLKPIIVVGHLLNGLALASILWYAFLALHYRGKPNPTRLNNSVNKWLWGGLLIVIAQITLGGWVSSHYAGLACIDFPYCNGRLFPAMQWNNLNHDLISIHMLHRFGAFITAAYLGVLAMALRKRITPFYSNLILGLLGLQLTLGILNILWLRPVWLAMIHHGVAIVLLLTMITLVTQAKRRVN